MSSELATRARLLVIATNVRPTHVGVHWRESSPTRPHRAHIGAGLVAMASLASCLRDARPFERGPAHAWLSSSRDGNSFSMPRRRRRRRAANPLGANLSRRHRPARPSASGLRVLRQPDDFCCF